MPLPLTDPREKKKLGKHQHTNITRNKLKGLGDQGRKDHIQTCPRTGTQHKFLKSDRFLPEKKSLKPNGVTGKEVKKSKRHT